MAPIRVGIIGLSTSTSFIARGGVWTSATHLPALQNLPEDYEIVALANSTVESAKRSVAAHNLPSSVKTYGSPEDIAKDPDVDLVVVSVAVGKHYDLAKPALLHKKKVLVEWPLASSAEEIEELRQLAIQSGVDTAVVSQARVAPAVRKLKEIIASGQIGSVLSSTAVQTSFRTMETWTSDDRYYLDISSGGNDLIITFGHFLDTFVDVLGDIANPQAVLKIHRPTARLLDRAGNVVDPSFRKTAPDHILVQGITDDGIVSSFSFRKSEDPIDGTGIRWIITGTKGEVSIIGPDLWQMVDKEFKLQVKVFGQPAETVDTSSHRVAAAEKVPQYGANIAALYAAFARGDKGSYSTFESAAKTHRLLDRIRAATTIQ